MEGVNDVSKLADNLHPLQGYKIRGLREPSGKENDAFIDALQKGLDDAEDGMYQAKLDSFLDTSRGRWLDYWGSWLGLHRLSRDDDTYREALKEHVLHKRDTIDALREAIAKYLKTNIGNIFIYEPFRDMFIWNGSRWNTYKFWPSTYYRYAVIDVQIDNPFNSVVNEIINLFRPAGVYWVITSLVNVLNKKAPIIDFSAFAGNRFITDDIDYIGFIKRNSHYINPNFSTKTEVDNPFIYNGSMLNGGKVYYRLNRAINGVAWFGQGNKDLIPNSNDNYLNGVEYIKTLSTFQNNQLSRIDNNGVVFNLAPQYNNQRRNLLSFASNWSLGNPVLNNSESGIKTTFYLDDDGHQVLRYDMPKGAGTAPYIGYLWYFKIDSSSKYLLTWDMRGENANGTNIRADVDTDRIGNTPISKNWNRFGATLTTEYNSYPETPLAFLSGLNDNTKDGWIEFRNPCLEKLSDDTDLTKITKIPAWIDNNTNLAKTTPYGIIDFYDYLASYFGTSKTDSGEDGLDTLLNQIDSSPIKNLITRFNYAGAGNSTNTLSAYAYNFDYNVWEKLADFNLTSDYQSYKLSFTTIKPYLNKHYLMFVKYVPSSYTGTLNTDYFGFSYGNTTFGELDCIMPSQLGLGSEVYSESSPAKYAVTGKARAGVDYLFNLSGITTLHSFDRLSTAVQTSLGSITYQGDSKYRLSLAYKFNQTVQPLTLKIHNQRTNFYTARDLTNGTGNLIGIVNIDPIALAKEAGMEISDSDNIDFTIFSYSSGLIQNVAINVINHFYKDYGQNLMKNDHKLLQPFKNAPSYIALSSDYMSASLHFAGEGVGTYYATLDDENSNLPDTATISFSAKGNGKIDAVEVYDLVTDASIECDTQIDLDSTYYQRISCTIDSGASKCNAIFFGVSGSPGQLVDIKDIKVETGVIATPYN